MSNSIYGVPCNLEQFKAFLDGTSEVVFRVPKGERNQFFERALKRLGYAPHGRLSICIQCDGAHPLLPESRVNPSKGSLVALKGLRFFGKQEDLPKLGKSF